MQPPEHGPSPLVQLLNSVHLAGSDLHCLRSTTSLWKKLSGSWWTCLHSFDNLSVEEVWLLLVKVGIHLAISQRERVSGSW